MGQAESSEERKVWFLVYLIMFF